MKRFMPGSLPPDDLRRVFLEGAKWWEYHSTGGTMWESDQDLALEEAERRYPHGESPLYERCEDGWLVEKKPLDREVKMCNE